MVKIIIDSELFCFISFLFSQVVVHYKPHCFGGSCRDGGLTTNTCRSAG